VPHERGRARGDGRPITECEKTGYWRLDAVRLTPVLQVRNDGIE